MSASSESDRYRPWFAWFPVQTILGRWVWLRRIERAPWSSWRVSPEEYERTNGLLWAYRDPRDGPDVRDGFDTYSDWFQSQRPGMTRRSTIMGQFHPSERGKDDE